jgi:hypothetical protein
MFLNFFEGVNSNYNTYGDLPVNIDGTGLDLKLNPGAGIFDTIISSSDTSFINYIKIEYDLSNVATKNGAIHFIENILELFRPGSRQVLLEFLEEPLIYQARQTPGNYRFDLEDREDFEVISWEGVEQIEYVNSATSLEGVWNRDYLEMEGEFSITYLTPQILPGNYIFQIKANDEYFNNAVIQVILDGERIGGNIDLSSNQSASSSFTRFTVGNVIFDNYENHSVTIQTLVPGRLTWDGIIFVPD